MFNANCHRDLDPPMDRTLHPNHNLTNSAVAITPRAFVTQSSSSAIQCERQLVNDTAHSNGWGEAFNGNRAGTAIQNKNEKLTEWY